MRAFVTGGTGFVGRGLVRALVSAYGSENVVCLVPPFNNPLERTGRAVLRELGVQTVVADIRSWTPTPGEIPPFDVLFHLAASIDSASLAHSSNDKGTENLLHVLGGALRGTRFMHVSSNAVMDRREPSWKPLDETDSCTPRTEYGRTKLRAERHVQREAETYGYSYAILRPGIIYGSGPKRPGGLFARLSQWLRDGHPAARLQWPGRTSIIAVDDVVRILVSVALEAGAANETYLLTAEAPAVGHIAATMAKALNVHYEPLRSPGWVWAGLRRSTALPGLSRVIPWPVFIQLWRLGHLVGNGLWCDGAKLRTVYSGSLIQFEEGVQSVLGPETSDDE